MDVPIFANSLFNPFEMARLTDLLNYTTFNKGEVLAKLGQPARQNLYIVQEGKITVSTATGMMTILGAGDYFGDRLIQANDGAVSQETITAVEKTTCRVLTKSV
jgi:CRP-like cAMP-binding protein